MPATKRQRTSGGPAAAQSTLSFNRTKPASTANRVTKSTKPSLSKTDKIPIDDIQKPPVEDVQPEPEVEAVPAQVEAEAEVSEEEEDVDEDEIDARKITQKEINAYWVAKEKASKAPTYHHKDLSVREKILREFDMNSQYGPCIGINRLDRWRRARDMKRKPPIEIFAVMLKARDEEDDALKKTTAKAQKEIPGTEDWRISVMDELITSTRAREEVAVDA